MSTKKDALKATGIVGGAQVISILIRIMRTKIIAVLLGPAGVGIAGLYQSTLEIVQRATGLGLDFSAVRDVAEAAGSDDKQRIGRTITVLRRWVWITGLLGLFLLVFFRKQFSLYAFKDAGHELDFLLLSVVPLFTALTGGQMAMLRGVRRIGDMALAGMLGAAAGFCITVPLYWLLGVKGIVPALILSSLAEMGLSWYFANRVKVLPIALTLRETMSGGARMIQLGLFTVITGVAGTGAMYLVRIFIADRMGVDGVGQFQAAWNISATYVGLILGAMAADYYPRLSAVNHDNYLVCKLVNEQTEITLLLAGPLIIGMIGFIDVVVLLFYSAKFGQSIDIMLWQTMGNLLKVVSWPMGFVLLAKGKGNYFVFTELLWNSIFLSTIWLLWNRSGIVSTGIAFLASYIVLTGVLLLFCKRMCTFSWSAKNKKSILIYTILSLLTFVNVRYRVLPFWRVVDIILLTIAIAFSYRDLKMIIDFKMMINKFLRRIN